MQNKEVKKYIIIALILVVSVISGIGISYSAKSVLSNYGTFNEEKPLGDFSGELSSIEVNPSVMSLEVGKTKSFSVTAINEDLEEFSVNADSAVSANSTIASVSGQTIKGEKAGSTTVTVRYGSEERTIRVTVTESIVKVTSVSLNKTSLSLTVGGSEILTATLLPTNATVKEVTWKSSNYSVATVTGGTVRAVGAGTATITATAADGSGETATCVVSVSADYSTYTISTASPEKLYLAKDGDGENVKIKVTDANGNMVEDLEFDITNNGYTEVSNTAYGEGSGYYFYTKSKSTGEVTDTIRVCIKGTSVCTSYQAYIYCAKWTEINNNRSFTLGYGLSQAHVTDTCYYRNPSDCEAVTDENGEIIEYKCSKYYYRCCGTPGGSGGTTTYACYKNDANDYKWASSAPSGYTKVDGITSESACKAPETPACYKDKNNNYFWGPYATNSAYTLVSGVTSEADCKAPAVPACYKNSNDDYVWTANPSSGYTLVAGISSANECKKTETPVTYACYVNNNSYIWSANPPAGYTIVAGVTSQALCKAPERPACYKDKNNNYVWGTYANNSGYTLIDDIETESACKSTVDVPSTASSVATIVYVSMAILIGLGIYFIYYARYKMD